MNSFSVAPSKTDIARLVMQVTTLWQSHGLAPPLRIVGIGSENGADSLGLRVTEQLNRQFQGVMPHRAEIYSLTAPHRMLDFLDGQGTLLIIDALSGNAHSDVELFTWPDPRIEAHFSDSSHSFGVSESLQLAEQVGLLPQQVLILGI